MKFSALALLCLAAVTFAAPIVQDQDLSLEKREPLVRNRNTNGQTRQQRKEQKQKNREQKQQQRQQKKLEEQLRKQQQQQQPKGSRSEGVTNGANAGTAVFTSLAAAAGESVNLAQTIQGFQGGQQAQGSDETAEA